VSAAVGLHRDNSIVFQPCALGDLELKNRLVRSATFESAASPEGEVDDAMIDIHSGLAAGGVGLIVTGAMAVHPDAGMPHQVSISDDAFIPGLKRVSDAVHGTGSGCRVMVQLQMPGRQLPDPKNTDRMLGLLPPTFLTYLKRKLEAGETLDEPHRPVEPTAPSAVYDALLERTPRELAVAEIEEIIDAFAEAIRRAREAGFDGAQLHAAHGWLLSSFLSPHTNQRQDSYGGSTANRARIVTEIVRRARAKVGQGFPILVKMNTTDFLPVGTTHAEAAQVAGVLAGAGVTAIEASGGMWEALTRTEEELGWKPTLIPESRLGIRTPEQEGYFLEGAREIKHRVDIPVIAVGGFRSFARVEELLAAGDADLVALSRPLIRQPDLPRLWLEGASDRADCLSCSGCLPFGGEPLHCRTERAG
jgi:2,4-dienoyl-CoA reductase-like NADH-dependent reductase (Old Yellow Enzyme family)